MKIDVTPHTASAGGSRCRWETLAESASRSLRDHLSAKNSEVAVAAVRWSVKLFGLPPTDQRVAAEELRLKKAKGFVVVVVSADVAQVEMVVEEKGKLDQEDLKLFFRSANKDIGLPYLFCCVLTLFCFLKRPRSLSRSVYHTHGLMGEARL